MNIIYNYNVCVLNSKPFYAIKFASINANQDSHLDHIRLGYSSNDFWVCK